MEDDEYTAVPSSAHPLVVDAEEYKSMARLPAQMTMKTPPPYSPKTFQQQKQINTKMIDNVQPAIFEEHPMARPPNYLGLTLLNLLCCCWPLGIVGLIYTLRVDSEFAAGHYGEARIASDSARKVNKVGFWIGTFLYLIWIIIIVVDVIVVTTVANGGFNDY